MRTIKVWKKVLAGVIMVFLAYGPTPLCGQEAVGKFTFDFFKLIFFSATDRVDELSQQESRRVLSLCGEF